MPQSVQNLPTQEYLNECFCYDPKTGYLFWRVRPRHHFKTSHGMNACNARYSNTRAGCLKAQGYIHISVYYKSYYAHRIIWTMIHGSFPPDQLDHKNHIRTDNRIKNLRLATNKENGQNQSMSSRNKSGTTGVYWDKHNDTWQSRIKFNEKYIYLGSFKDKADAIKAREAANIKYGFHPNHGGSK
jgi:hypothetical protein